MEDIKKNIPVIIPAYEPDEKLLSLLQRLAGEGIGRIVVVDDGSGDEYRAFFDRAEETEGCTLIRHAVNLGKGRALKTAFNYCLNEWPDLPGVVTADSDGQHSVEDICRCMEALADSPGSLILGKRDFGGSDVPAKSMLGNRITSAVFKIAMGLKISDTQTGLRGIGSDFMKTLMNVDGERYEFETNMLIETRPLCMPIVEIPIRTIYIDDNSASHFRPVRDSARIYFLIIKYLMSSGVSSIIDLGLFTLFCGIFKGRFDGFDYILLATFLARVISAVCNYFINLRVVFASKESVRNSFWKYALLAAATLCASGFLVRFIYPLVGGLETFIKLPVDTCLFFINYKVQREYIFRS